MKRIKNQEPRAKNQQDWRLLIGTSSVDFIIQIFDFRFLNFTFRISLSYDYESFTPTLFVDADDSGIEF